MKVIDLTHSIHPGMPVYQISAKSGEGFDGWLQWIKDEVTAKKTV